jgi:hypothetical protein
MGYLTNDVLQDYQNFQTAGMVVKKSTYEDFGGFKSSIKLTFVYEFLLRLTYNSVQIMTIPETWIQTYESERVLFFGTTNLVMIKWLVMKSHFGFRQKEYSLQMTSHKI